MFLSKSLMAESLVEALPLVDRFRNREQVNVTYM